MSSIHPYPVIETPEAGVLRRLIEEAQQWERSGQQVTARRRYEKALELLGDSDPRLSADLTRWIGRTFVPEGDLESARLTELSTQVSQAANATYDAQSRYKQAQEVLASGSPEAHVQMRNRRVVLPGYRRRRT